MFHLALANVVRTQSVELLITVLYVVARPNIQAIHFTDALLYGVSIYFEYDQRSVYNCKENTNYYINTNLQMSRIIFTAIEITQNRADPCVPSPCGPNSLCQNIRDIASCTCKPDYEGSPPNCKPECSINQDCVGNLACINNKCRDPCPGSCGINAECQVISHFSVCTCIDGYTGNAFTQCQQLLHDGKLPQK